MEMCRLLLLLLWTSTTCVMSVKGDHGEPLIKNFTNMNLHVVPHNEENSTVTALLMGGNLVSLTDQDRLALSTYPGLEELHLDQNLIPAVTARFFSVVPHLRVLSLSRNNISSLDPEAFTGLDVLVELDLSQNLLTSLPMEIMRGQKNLQMLNLQNNPWNCSCLLLSTIKEMDAQKVSFGGPQVTCASPPQLSGRSLLDATSQCYTSPTDPQTPTTTAANTQQPEGSTATTLMTTQSAGQNHSSKAEQVPVLGNTWKFTACVVALALTTSILIVCAIKGPSWYKLFHNYRHRRLQENEEDGASTRRHRRHQTFTFKTHRGQVEGVEEEEEEEEEDGYIEDPYIKRED